MKLEVCLFIKTFGKLGSNNLAFTILVGVQRNYANSENLFKFVWKIIKLHGWFITYVKGTLRCILIKNREGSSKGSELWSPPTDNCQH